MLGAEEMLLPRHAKLLQSQFVAEFAAISALPANTASSAQLQAALLPAVFTFTLDPPVSSLAALGPSLILRCAPVSLYQRDCSYLI